MAHLITPRMTASADEIKQRCAWELLASGGRPDGCKPDHWLWAAAVLRELKRCGQTGCQPVNTSSIEPIPV